MSSSKLVSGNAPLPLHRLGDYELVRRVATGAMAEIYEARRAGARGFAKRVAVKRILPQLRLDPRFVRMFCAEARVHAALSHPNLVSVLDFGEHEGELYLVMEYVDGVSLAEVMTAVTARKRSVDLAPALYTARELACGLSYAHAARDDEEAPLGIVHRDVAPNNVLLGRSGEVKLTDFGIVHSSWSDVRTAPGELRGKVGYVSPEQSLGRGVDARSDLFSLGVVLSEMLLGEPLFAGHNELTVLTNLQRGKLERLDRLHGRVPEELVGLLRRMLSTKPEVRPANAAEVVEALDAIAAARRLVLDAHSLASWLKDLGVIRIDSHVRRSSRGEQPESADEATIVDELPAFLRADPAPSGAGHPRYRIRRANGAVEGPVALGELLGRIATGRVDLQTEVAREQGSFMRVQRAFELTRLAGRPLYRFADPIEVLATERRAVEAGTHASTLFGLALRRATGLLVLRDGAALRRVFLVDGAPAQTASSDATELLGSMLLAEGKLSTPDLYRVLESGFRSGCRLGESLLGAGLLGAAELTHALEEQRRRRLLGLAAARSGELFFVEGAKSGEETKLSPLPALGAWAAAFRAALPEPELSARLRGLDRTRLRPGERCAELRAALGLETAEAYAFDLALRAVPIGLILREAQARPGDARKAAAFALFAGLSAGALLAAD